jgi:hypothetical protein
MPEHENAMHPAHIQWLSGEVVTPLNMYPLPWIWYGTLAAGMTYFTLHFDHFPDLRQLGPFELCWRQ